MCMAVVRRSLYVHGCSEEVTVCAWLLVRRSLHVHGCSEEVTVCTWL